MTMKSKLTTTALFALVAMSALATTSANAGWIFVPENATRFCDDVTFSCGTYIAPQETRRYQYIAAAAPRRPPGARSHDRPRSRR